MIKPKPIPPEKVIIWGASGHAKVVANILRMAGFEIAGFIDELNSARDGEPFYGASVLTGPSGWESQRRLGVQKAIVAFGDNGRRLASADKLESCGFELISAVHSSAILAADLSLGQGSVMGAGCIVNPAVAVGRCVILNTNATLDHDCRVEDGAHIGPGVSIGGHVKIGRCAWVGIGATVIDHKSIGANSIVGAGAVVIHDVPEGAVVAGVPARVMRQNNAVE